MKTGQTAEILQGFMIKLGNRDTCMGQHYPEDTWSITSAGETIEEAVANIILRIFSSGIEIDYAYYDGALYINYDEDVFRRQIIIKEFNMPMDKPSSYDIKNMIYNHPLYIKLKKEKDESKKLAAIESKRLADENAKKAKKKLEDDEKQELKRLTEKYGKLGV